MATPTIKIDQTPLVAGSPGVSRTDLAVGASVTLTDPANGAGSYSWELVIPPGSSTTLSGANTAIATFTPDVNGTYLAYLTFNSDQSFTENADGNKVSSQGGGAIKHRKGVRALGVGETFQFAVLNGYAEEFHSNFATIDAVEEAKGASEGTIFYSDSNGDLERLTPGVAGEILTTGGPAATPSWATLSHGSLDDLLADNHTQYLLVDGTRNVSGFIEFDAGVVIGGNTVSDVLLSTDPISASDAVFVTAGYIDTHVGVITESTVHLVGSGGFFQDVLNSFYDGSLVEEASAHTTSDGTTITYSIEKDGGGDIYLRTNDATHVLIATPTAATVTLVAGTDTVPQINYVYCTESGGTVTLGSSTSGWPIVEYAALSVIFCQSALGVQSDGPLKVHAYTDHLHNSHQGHLAEMNRWIRLQAATWTSGVAPADITFSSPDAYISTSVGVVYQLHEHSFPVRDMSLGDPVWLVNDPTTTYKKITTLDDITQLADGGIVENKWFSLVLWGCVNEDDVDCKLFINLPNGSYNTQAAAELDSSSYDVFAIPHEFKGTGFLIAKYIVKGKDSGLWEQGSKVDLRGLFPTSSPGASGATTDHGNLIGLLDDDHTQYLLIDGTRAMTGSLALTDANSLITRPAASEIGINTAGTEAVRWDALQNQVNAGDITLNDDNKLIIGDTYNHYLTATDSTWLRVYTAGSQRIAITASQVQFINTYLRPNSHKVLTIGLAGARWSTFYGQDLDLEHSAIGTAETVGINLINDTLASTGAQQYSPMSVLGGSGWKTDATAESQTVQFAQQVVPVEGAANPTGSLVFKSDIDGAGYVDVFSIGSDGDAIVGPGIANPRLRFGTAHASSYIWGTSAAFYCYMGSGQWHVLGQGYHRINSIGSSATLPTLQLGSTDSGLFKPAASELGVTTSLTEAVRWDALQDQINSGNVNPNTDSTYSLGITSLRWSELFVDDITVTANLTVGGDIAITSGDITMDQFSVINAGNVTMLGQLEVFAGTTVSPSIVGPSISNSGFRFGSNFISVVSYGIDAITLTEFTTTIEQGSYTDSLQRSAFEIITGGATGSVTMSSEHLVQIDMSNTVECSALTPRRGINVISPRYSSQSAITIPTAATIYIDGKPLASTNVTITDSWGLWIGAGGGAQINGSTHLTQALASKVNDRILLVEADSSITNQPATDYQPVTFDLSSSINHTADGGASAIGIRINHPTFTSDTSSSTMGSTAIASLYIDGAPAVGSNMSFNSTPYALLIDSGTVRLDGDLEHNGSNIGFYGATPVAQSSAYSRAATISESRSLLSSVSATTTNNNNVLAAIIADLQSLGLIGL